MSAVASGFLSALSALARAGVDFVLVGVGGINFYARDPSEAVVTLDLDALLPPDARVLRSARSVLRSIGFSFAAGGEPLVDLDDEDALAAVVRSQATITARDAEGTQIDLMLAITGTRYEDLVSDAVAFRLGDVTVRVRSARAPAARQAGSRARQGPGVSARLQGPLQEEAPAALTAAEQAALRPASHAGPGARARLQSPPASASGRGPGRGRMAAGARIGRNDPCPCGSSPTWRRCARGWGCDRRTERRPRT